MTRAQQIERVTGLIAGLLGLAIVGFVAFGPVGNVATSSTNGSNTRGTAGLATAGAGVWFFLAMLAVVLLGIAGAALMHSQTGSGAWHSVLLVATVLLAVGVVLSLPSIGILLVPSLLLAVVACGFSFRRGPALARS